MASGLTALAQWVYLRLSGDATLIALGTPPLSTPSSGTTGPRIYRKSAPQGVTYPHLLIHIPTVNSYWGQGYCRLPSSAQLWIHCIDQNQSDADLWAMLNRCEALLTGDLRTIGSGIVMWSTPYREREYDEDDAGIKYQHRVAEYRLNLEVA